LTIATTAGSAVNVQATSLAGSSFSPARAISRSADPTA
jgi:hypothetical protein